MLLEPSPAALQARLAQRATAGNHFMPPSLLASQLGTLQYHPAELYMHFEGEAALRPPRDIVSEILQRLRERRREQPGSEQRPNRG